MPNVEAKTKMAAISSQSVYRKNRSPNDGCAKNAYAHELHG
jgi:hypothetical protein